MGTEGVSPSHPSHPLHDVNLRAESEIHTPSTPGKLPSAAGLGWPFRWMETSGGNRAERYRSSLRIVAIGSFGRALPGPLPAGPQGASAGTREGNRCRLVAGRWAGKPAMAVTTRRPASDQQREALRGWLARCPGFPGVSNRANRVGMVVDRAGARFTHWVTCLCVCPFTRRVGRERPEHPLGVHRPRASRPVLSRGDHPGSPVPGASPMGMEMQTGEKRASPSL